MYLLRTVWDGLTEFGNREACSLSSLRQLENEHLTSSKRRAYVYLKWLADDKNSKLSCILYKSTININWKKTFIEAGEQTWFEHRPAGEALCYTDLNHLVKYPKKIYFKKWKAISNNTRKRLQNVRLMHFVFKLISENIRSSR